MSATFQMAFDDGVRAAEQQRARRALDDTSEFNNYFSQPTWRSHTIHVTRSVAAPAVTLAVQTGRAQPPATF
jgi:hypothetical protein